jgi:hypothetical protein
MARGAAQGARKIPDLANAQSTLIGRKRKHNNGWAHTGIDSVWRQIAVEQSMASGCIGEQPNEDSRASIRV